jgi:hypothetical protein
MVPNSQSSPLIAGSVLPIKRAEELLATLPGVIAARIIAGETGSVDEIHVLTTAEVTPKQTVRNIESALIAHLGMRVDHRKISVATSLETRKPREEKKEEPAPPPVVAPTPAAPTASEVPVAPAAPQAVIDGFPGREYYFEDVEVRRSRASGIMCRVTLTKGDKSLIGEAEGFENERSRIELAARATLRAISAGEPEMRPMALDGVKLIEAFDREFVFVGVTAPMARESVLLTGSCELKESAETASVLAVLDATNRWMTRLK